MTAPFERTAEVVAGLSDLDQSERSITMRALGCVATAGVVTTVGDIVVVSLAENSGDIIVPMLANTALFLGVSALAYFRGKQQIESLEQN